MNNLAFYLARIYYNLTGQSVNGFTDSHYAEKIYRHIAGLPSGLSGGKNVSFWLENWLNYRTGQSYRLALGDRPAWFWLSKLYASYVGLSTEGILQPASAEFWAEKLFTVITPQEIRVEINGTPLADGAAYSAGTVIEGTAETRIVRVYNDGNRLLTLSNPVASGQLSAGNFSDLTIDPGGNAFFVVTLDTSGGSVSRSGTIQFANSDTDENPFNFTVSFDAYPALPFTDTFNRADGALGNGWTAATWAIASNRAANHPVLGAELLTDPGLEANYTAGKCDTLTIAAGLPALAQSADAHEGTKAQQFTAVAGGNALRFPLVNITRHTWLQYSSWSKRSSGSDNSGSFRISQSGGIAISAANFLSSSYTQEKIAILAINANQLTPEAIRDEGSGTFSTFIIDDFSLKAISDVYSLKQFNQADVRVGIVTPGLQASFADDTYMGVILRADSLSNPANYIGALLRTRQNTPNNGVVLLYKRVGETYTVLISETIVTLAAGGILEIRGSGTTISAWYDSVQVGTNQTVSDGAILDNKIHGMVSSGANSVDTFSVEAS